MGNSTVKWGFLECLECHQKTKKQYQREDESQLGFRERILDEWRKKQDVT